MSEPVYRALKRVVKNQGKKVTITVDGYIGFYNPCGHWMGSFLYDSFTW